MLVLYIMYNLFGLAKAKKQQYYTYNKSYNNRTVQQ